MQKTELRFGNFVLLDNPMHRPRESGKIHKVVGITEKSAHIMRIHDNLMQDYYGQFYKFIKPIPLTKEWLNKFGFVSNGVTYELPNFRFQISRPLNYEGFVFCDGYLSLIHI